MYFISDIEFVKVGTITHPSFPDVNFLSSLISVDDYRFCDTITTTCKAINPFVDYKEYTSLNSTIIAKLKSSKTCDVQQIALTTNRLTIDFILPDIKCTAYISPVKSDGGILLPDTTKKRIKHISWRRYFNS